MNIVDENSAHQQLRNIFSIQIKHEIEYVDECIANRTTAHWNNLGQVYKLLDKFEPTQRNSIVIHRDLIRAQINADHTLDGSQKENLQYKATLLVVQDALEHTLPTLHGDYSACEKTCDYKQYADHDYVALVTRQLLADIVKHQDNDHLQR